MAAKSVPFFHLLVAVFMACSVPNSKAMEASPVFQATVLAGAAIGLAGIAIYASDLIDVCTLTETQRAQIEILKQGAQELDRAAWKFEHSENAPTQETIATIEQKIAKTLPSLEQMLDPAIRNRVPDKLHAAALATHRAIINVQDKLALIKNQSHL